MDEKRRRETRKVKREGRVRRKFKGEKGKSDVEKENMERKIKKKVLTGERRSWKAEST